MLRIDGSAQEVFNNLTFRVETPDGEMFVSVMEDKQEKICAIDIKIGKAGSSLGAWAHSFARLITMAIEHGVTVEELITELSSQTSDRLRLNNNGVNVRSGVEGVYVALTEYKRDKYQQLVKDLDFDSLKGPQLYGRRAKDRSKT